MCHALEGGGELAKTRRPGENSPGGIGFCIFLHTELVSGFRSKGMLGAFGEESGEKSVVVAKSQGGSAGKKYGSAGGSFWWKRASTPVLPVPDTELGPVRNWWWCNSYTTEMKHCRAITLLELEVHRGPAVWLVERMNGWVRDFAPISVFSTRVFVSDGLLVFEFTA